MTNTPSNETTDGIASPVDLTTSERHRLLASARRKLTLEILDETTAPIDLDELAARLFARETGADGDETAVERVAIALHHVHLPKLDSAGVLRYDPRSHLVEFTDRRANAADR